MEKLTKKQENVLVCIKKFLAEKGYPPTVREIGNQLGLSSSATTQFHICKLAEKGYIRKNNTKNRTIELLVPNEFDKRRDTIVDVPLLGKVTAGFPTQAIELKGEYFSIPTSVLGKKKEVFALRVLGDSMINAGIFNKDIVIVERVSIAKNGDIVVAMTDEDEVTVKRFYKERNHFRLQPENDLMEPIILDNVKILGKVVGLYRKF